MCDQQRIRPACAYAQSDQSLCLSLDYSMAVKLLTEHHLEFVNLKGGCTGSSESTLAKMPHCWKSHVTAQLCSFLHFFSWCSIITQSTIFSNASTKRKLSDMPNTVPPMRLELRILDLESITLSLSHCTHILKDFKNAKNENYHFLHPEHFSPSLTDTNEWLRFSASIFTQYLKALHCWFTRFCTWCHHESMKQNILSFRM